MIGLALEIGRVCMKTAGREAGKYCVVLKKVNDAFVMVTGPKLLTGVKRRKCNVEHLEPLPYTLEIKEEAAEEEVIAALDRSGLVTKFDLKKPSAAEVKAEKAKPTKEEKPKEKPKRKIKFKIGGGKEKETKEEKKSS